MLHIANNSEFELYLQDEHFETIASKFGALLHVWPLRSQNLDLCLFFNNYETVKRCAYRVKIAMALFTRPYLKNKTEMYFLIKCFLKVKLIIDSEMLMRVSKYCLFG